MSKSYTFKIDREVALSVNYTHTPAEKQTLEYPGLDADIYVNSVKVNTVEIVHVLSNEELERIKEECWDDLGVRLDELSAIMDATMRSEE